mgnify:CR=1 FL=1
MYRNFPAFAPAWDRFITGMVDVGTTIDAIAQPSLRYKPKLKNF